LRLCGGVVVARVTTVSIFTAALVWQVVFCRPPMWGPMWNSWARPGGACDFASGDCMVVASSYARQGSHHGQDAVARNYILPQHSGVASGQY
jgi:hypothetical protein